MKKKICKLSAAVLLFFSGIMEIGWRFFNMVVCCKRVKALEAGAFALVVGGAITRPAEITARFTGAIHAMNK